MNFKRLVGLLVPDTRKRGEAGDIFACLAHLRRRGGDGRSGFDLEFETKF